MPAARSRTSARTRTARAHRRTYRLSDVERTHRAHPRTFSIPRSDRRRGLALGDVVKLVFVLVEPRAGDPHAERMWVEIVERASDGESYVGVLQNEPLYLRGLEAGARVPFGPQHVAGIVPGDRTLGALVGVGVGVLRRGEWPAWIAKVAPADKQDSGWRVFSARDARGKPVVRALTTSTMLRAWAVADSVINTDTDGSWRWNARTLEYVPAQLPPSLARAAKGDLGRLHMPPPPDDQKAVVTKRALRQPPAFAQQLGRTKGHDDDSGWAIFVGTEQQAYLDNTRNSTVVPVARLLHLYPYLERVLGEKRHAVWTWDDELADWRVDGD